MLRLCDNRLSGNGYKPRLPLAHPGRRCARVELDPCPAFGAWLARVADLPGQVPMNPAPEGIVEPAGAAAG